MTETEFADRLERLERDNRRLKRLATVALIIAAALGAIYAARPVPDKIEAHEFDVVDARGRALSQIGIKGGTPFLFMLSATREGDITMSTAGGPEIQLHDSTGFPRERLLISPAGPEVLLYGARWSKGHAIPLSGPSKDTMFLGAKGLEVNDDGSGQIVLESEKGSPHIGLSDSEGFSMNLGSVGTVNKITGATQQTSAASITMFGNTKGHHVIWQAP